MANPLVSPLKLKRVTHNRFRPLQKLNCNSQEPEVNKTYHTLSDTEDTETSEDDSIINLSTPSKNGNTRKDKNESSKVLSQAYECTRKVPGVPSPSPINNKMKLPLKSRNQLNTQQLVVKLISLVNVKMTPTNNFLCHDKENSPIKHVDNIHSPLGSNLQAAQSPLRSSSKRLDFEYNENRLISPEKKTPKKLTWETGSKSLVSKLILDSPAKSILNSPRKSVVRSPARSVSKNSFNIFSPSKSLRSPPSRCQNSPAHYGSNALLSSPKRTPNKRVCGRPAKYLDSSTKSPLKQFALDEAHSLHPKSPLKQLVDRVDLRRSPRKHPPPLRSPCPDSPVRKLALADDGSDEAEKAKVLSAVRRALSHSDSHETPLVGRQSEVSTMTHFIKTCLEDHSPGAMYVSGAPGTGKTAALTQILNTLPEAAGVRPLWVNCMGVQCSSGVYGRIGREMGVPVQATELKTVRAIEEHICAAKKPIVLVLDEIDQLETRHQAVLYTLFEWPSLQSCRLVLLAIANRLDLTERVLPRLAIGPWAPHRLHFAPYTKQQIVDILTDRLNNSGVCWRGVVRPPALQLLAGKVASVAGDARRAIDVCRRALEKCQQGGGGGVVGMSSIVSIFNEVYGSRVVEAVSAAPASFPLQQKILLCTLLLVCKHAKTKDITVGKLQEVYRSVCKNRLVAGVDASEFVPLCSLLHARAMITLGKNKDIRMAKVSLRLDASEAELVLGDRELMMQVLEDREALGRLAKKEGR